MVSGYRQLPNQVTVLRLILAGAFFAVIDRYQYPGQPDESLWLTVAVVLFIVAALTDSLDGYLARKWRAESQFGRIMDPLCDKVLIIGAFIFLAGPSFVIPSATDPSDKRIMISGVYPWMVVVMLVRELLVTGIRSQLEFHGIEFAARSVGKLKMIAQSVSVPVILLIVWLDPLNSDRQWLAYARDILVYTMVAVTVISGLPYVISAAGAIRSGEVSGGSGGSSSSATPR